ncbi:MAG: hypothetical protein KKF48_02640 [Nanoarchaeota archaeon]|nr:hypothetical protein [Nanoarchaeota archaeon]MBU1027919.1 hypothetical protein [Nanoarchaeota archaeon]
MKLCYKCGTLLKKTNWGRLFCPNCGILDINERLPEEENGGDKSYIR